MKIAIMAGDGIGPEVVRQAVKVLRGVAPQAETEEAPIGQAGVAHAHSLEPVQFRPSTRNAACRLATTTSSSLGSTGLGTCMLNPASSVRVRSSIRA